MELSIRNIGRFNSAQVKLDGITVICGENSTGKSTIGKVLFSCFNSMCGLEEKIRVQRQKELSKMIIKDYMGMDHQVILRMGKITDDYMDFLLSLNGNYTYKNVMKFWERYPETIARTFNRKDITSAAIELMNKSNKDLFHAFIFRCFDNTFAGQIRNLNSSPNAKALVTVQFREGRNTIRFWKNRCALETNQVQIQHPAYYIDNPFVVDDLNTTVLFRRDIENNVIAAIQEAKKEQAADQMSDLFDAVSNKKKLEKIYSVLRTAYKGHTEIHNGVYQYKDENASANVDFLNLSTGLKSFALIERLLESGKLKQKDVLILDEPEIHLHPEWQLVYAETIVLLQKEFDLTVLITTHSPYFLEAIEVFTKKHKTNDKAAYYLATNDGLSSKLEEVSGNLEEIYKLMFTPLQKLEDMENGIYE